MRGFLWFRAVLVSFLFASATIAIAAVARIHTSDSSQAAVPARAGSPGGYVVEHDGEVAKNEPGTHDGGGQTVGYSFFAKAPGLHLVFRKRALKPGSGIGYHEQKEDEIYYVLSGRGVMTVDGKSFDVTPGTAGTDEAGQLARSQAGRDRRFWSSFSTTSRLHTSFIRGASPLGLPYTFARAPLTSLIRGASPLGLPYTFARAPLRRRAPLTWLARRHSLAQGAGCAPRAPRHVRSRAAH